MMTNRMLFQHKCIKISNTIYVDIFKRIGEVAMNLLLLLIRILLSHKSVLPLGNHICLCSEK